MNAASELLSIWERAVAAAPAERDDALLAAACRESPPASLSARNAALLGIRARLFGARQPLLCDCPRCGVAAEFEIDCSALSQTLQPAGDALQPQRLRFEGRLVEFRVPDVADLRDAALSTSDDAAFQRFLLARCVLSHMRPDGEPCASDPLPASLAAALSRRMEELEPGASVRFELSCPACGGGWSATMNVGDVLWSELRSRAERLLLDVDALAHAYGWSEADVLAMSPARRAAYLQLVGAA